MSFRGLFGIVLGIVTAAAVAAPTPAWKAGDRVFARRSEEIYSYPATVLGAKGKGYEILTDVGAKRLEVPATDLAPLDVKIGSAVYGNWQKRGFFYPGTVTLKEGEQIRLQYEDGDQEMTTLGELRVVTGKVDVRCIAGEAIFAAVDPSGRLFYPVTVIGAENERVRVKAGPNEFLVDSSLTRPFNVVKGDRVLGRWQNGPSYFPGRVEKVTKDRIQVQYDDGDVEWTSAGLTMLLPAVEKTVKGHCLDDKTKHVARKEPLELAPLPAPPRGPGKLPQSI